ncbi:tyrosine--tRNA ligase [Erysipelothrix larvae]|nr:tyrosine--tRNA ligase [Erysipelothrix larvae]
MNFFEELEWRGLVKDVAHKEEFLKRLNKPITLYCGFDPTAESLHIGHLQQLILLKRFQLNGHHPIALVGGGTGMIGDPRPTTERKMLSAEDLMHNVQCIGSQIDAILASDDNPVTLVNNYDWLKSMNIIDFLRDYGKFFSVSTMIAKDTIAKRLETGISFTEFSYTILQAVDYLHLLENYDVRLQFGGSDQWGNLVSGLELIRKVKGIEEEAFAMTSPLITKSDGTKFGKSEGQNVWLNADYTSPYEFYQYLINVSDDDVINFMKRLSLKPVSEIQEIEAAFVKAPHERLAQKELATELTRIVHGQEGLDNALKMTKAFFSGDLSELSAQQVKALFHHQTPYTLDKDSALLDVLVNAQFVPSKREARQLITSNAIRVNGEVVNDLEYVLSKEQAIDGEISVIRRGKKTYHVVIHG